MKVLSFFVAVAMTATAFANTDHPHRAELSTVTLIGEGRAAAQPEYATFQSTVTSLCYEQAQAGKRANDELANRILEVMKRYQAGTEGKVTATGGSYARTTEYYQAGQETKILCTNRFRITNTLTLKTNALDKLAEIQDALLTAIGSTEIRPTPEQPEQSRATLSAPSYSFTKETRTRLRRQAQTAALLDAKEQLENIRSVCPLSNARVHQIAPVGDAVVTPRFASKEVALAGSATPTIPDDLEIHESFRVIYVHEGCAAALR